VAGPESLVSRETILHKPVGQKQVVEGRDWLPDGPLRIGVTAGASTPDVVIGAVVGRVLELRGIPAPDEQGATLGASHR
jgi:4-hydroxy-3-methylbut-2-enyl diphosphate reductase